MTSCAYRHGKGDPGYQSRPVSIRRIGGEIFCWRMDSPSIGVCNIEMCNDISKVWPYRKRKDLTGTPQSSSTSNLFPPLSTTAPARPYRFCAACQPCSRLSCLDCQSRASWINSMIRLGKKSCPSATRPYAFRLRSSFHNPHPSRCSSQYPCFCSIHLPWRLQICLNVE
jgi:hypothetical protein